MATLPRMKPKCFYDVVIEVAIIRPGPIQGDMVHPYLARRAGREPLTYFDPRLEPVLKRTLGVPLFQEQMLKIAMVMADFSGDEAEELRRALSFHRSQERMNKVSAKLRAAMERKGVAPDKIEKIMQSITSFALYGFPGIARNQFRHSGVWQRVFKSASRAGILREPVEQSADGFLHARDDCERCAAARDENEAGLRLAIRLALHSCFQRSTDTSPGQGEADAKRR